MNDDDDGNDDDVASARIDDNVECVCVCVCMCEGVGTGRCAVEEGERGGLVGDNIECIYMGRQTCGEPYNLRYAFPGQGRRQSFHAPITIIVIIIIITIKVNGRGRNIERMFSGRSVCMVDSMT